MFLVGSGTRLAVAVPFHEVVKASDLNLDLQTLLTSTINIKLAILEGYRKADSWIPPLCKGVTSISTETARKGERCAMSADPIQLLFTAMARSLPSMGR